MSQPSRSKLAQAILDATGQDAARCYQCGKCTAGCPMAAFMDIAPNQVLRLVQLGTDSASRRLLASAAIWNCLGCLTCARRCPKQLDLAAVMDRLRELACQSGTVPGAQRNVLAFHRAFLASVRSHGRMNELPLVRRYKLSTRDLFSDIKLAPGMFFRGKLPLRPHKIAGRAEIRRIFDACQHGASTGSVEGEAVEPRQPASSPGAGRRRQTRGGRR
ncbi:MAG: 4Fe-4S dicluster domain-containing protein [Phycisphaerae bacterium]|nr:4Fe-4S dicluster domain-containing protein [Phycisphaerae bacterium]